jgi:hypothetical protein
MRKNSELVCLLGSSNGVMSINLALIPDKDWERAVEELPDFGWYPFGMRITPLFFGMTGVMLYMCLSSLGRINRNGAGVTDPAAGSVSGGVEMTSNETGADPETIASLPLIKYNAKEAQSFWQQQGDKATGSDAQGFLQQQGDKAAGNESQSTTEGMGGVTEGVVCQSSGHSGDARIQDMNMTSLNSTESQGMNSIQSFNPNIYHLTATATTPTLTTTTTTSRAHGGGNKSEKCSAIGGERAQGESIDVHDMASPIAQVGMNQCTIDSHIATSDSSTTATGARTDDGGRHSRAGTSCTLTQDECCSICLVEFVADESLRQLPCGHLYHPECVDVWLLGNASCPLCKASIRSPRVSPTSMNTAFGQAQQGVGADAADQSLGAAALV